MPQNEPMDLIYQLIGYPNETEWIEFKEGNSDPEQIGRDISALANSAAYAGRECAYKVWGVSDGAHELVGTSFNPLAAKAKGNQDLQIWLRRMLSANANYEFVTIEHEALVFVVARISAAVMQPVYFQKRAYVRIGSSTTELVAGSAREAELWRRLQRSDFEKQVAESGLTDSEVLEALDVDSFFGLLNLRRPEQKSAVVAEFVNQDMVRPQDDGGYAITNLGALLVARKLSDFAALRKRVLRVIRFDGKGCIDILDDQFFDEGYATAISRAESYIMSAVPSREMADGAFRRVVRDYPQRAVRELLSNTVIHQDLSNATVGPTVGIYSNRIEFSNPGVSLVPPERMLNALPRTRNNALAGLLRQMDLCEEGGTGWDRIIESCEGAMMMAPKIESDEQVGTKVTLFAGSGYDRMTKRQRMDAAYWHACLLYSRGESMNNQSLRERFGLTSEQKSTVAISRLLRDCCTEGLIREEDEEASAKFKRYIPAWA